MQQATNAGQDVPVDQCDVLDKASLTRYRELRGKWLDWLRNDPNHPIWRQIVGMIDNDLSVRTLSQAAESDPASPLHNRMIAQTILGGHRYAQVLGIRRLMDPRSDVISLGRLLKELKENVAVLTRENYVSGTGLPHDASSANSNAILASIPSAGTTGSSFVSWDSPLGKEFQTKRAHDTFDRLARVSASARQRTDQIPQQLIDQLEAHIDSSGVDEVIKWSHEFVAHAADINAPGWRGAKITFEKVTSVQKSVVQIVAVVSAYILQGPAFVNVVPVAQFNRFDRLDRLFSAAALAKAKELWNVLESDRNSWLQNNRGSPDLLTVIGWP